MRGNSKALKKDRVFNVGRLIANRKSVARKQLLVLHDHSNEGLFSPGSSQNI